MRQLAQDLGSGELRLVEVPAPVVRPKGVLVRTRASVISIGTERTKLEFGKKSLLGKARERPDQVMKVLDTARKEGLGSAYRKVRSRLSGLSPMGYSCAGVVEAVGEGVEGVRVGDAVACAGAGYANHAERVWAPKNLVVPVPAGVPFEAAAFTTLGAIALHGVRQADVRLGETVAVVGLGILGQLTVQLLRAAGARVVAIDVDAGRVDLAGRHGARAFRRSEDVAGQVRALTAGIGADAAIITAATSSDDPVQLAGALARDRGRVVVVGAVPTRPSRNEWYLKELELRLSRSYGPGRYDPDYEEKGHDYPIGYVRWTERRNMEEFLRLLQSGAVVLDELITHRFPFAEAERAYAALSGESGRSALGVVLEYPAEATPEPRRIVLAPPRVAGTGRARVRVGLIGAGSFATGTLVPALSRLGAELRAIATAGGLSARSAGERHGFAYLAASAEEVLADPEIDAVLIATRHADHAALATAALRAGKATFVEKPLALDEASLDEVLAAAAASAAPLMVGFNRRFAPATRFVRERLAGRAGPRMVHIRVNAGYIPPESWVHDPESGGGRLIGEGCHFIDLATFLAGEAPVAVSAAASPGMDGSLERADNVVVTVRYAGGSLATVLYTSSGHARAGKERVEVFAGGATAVIDDFRRAEVWGARAERWKGNQDKGHAAELERFLAAVRDGGTWPIPLAELAASSRATLRAAQALATGAWRET
ncbi:MAG TPA: bi-domain-containing oxidoreductase [Longimicrobiales bacterium]|nr:bi-domain-containing oxidoreductase [Longimicrobiales bacterium]